MTSDRQKLVKLIQDSIDKGATTVEEIHKSIADLPLKILEESDLLREPAKEVRQVQDRTLGAIYDRIRDINEKVGGLASELLAKAPARKGAGHAPHAKHRAAAHAHGR